MKKPFVLLFLCFCIAMMLAGCKVEEKQVEARLDLHNLTDLASSPAASPEGGSFVLEFTSSLPWTAKINSSNTQWLDILPTSGYAGDNPIVLTSEPNTSSEERVGIVQITCGDIYKEVTLIQKGSQVPEDFLEVSHDHIEISPSGSRFSLEIKTNLDYTVDILADWISRITTDNIKEGELEFEAAANPLEEDRTGFIVIEAGDHSVTVTVLQSGTVPEDYFELSPREVDVPAEGGEVIIHISTNLDYTLDIPADWITLVSGDGIKEGDLVFHVDENPESESRTGAVIICAGMNCHNVTINQAGQEIFLPEVLTLEVHSITTTSAICRGYVTSDGNSPVTARGVVWSTSPDPTIELETKTTDGSGTGTFSSSVTGLQQNTIYYIRAYATNTKGTSYGEEITFTTKHDNHTGDNEDFGNDEDFEL